MKLWTWMRNLLTNFLRKEEVESCLDSPIVDDLPSLLK